MNTQNNLQPIIIKVQNRNLGVFKNQYLKSLTDQIKIQISSEDLIQHFGIKRNRTIANRCICPFHSGASNQTSLSFNDTKKVFTCHACGAGGSYLDFILMKLGYSKGQRGGFPNAVIYAANHFTNSPLPFDSTEDLEHQIEQMVIEQYNETQSLVERDYHNIKVESILSGSAAPNTKVMGKKPSQPIAANPPVKTAELLDSSDAISDADSYSYTLSVIDAAFSNLITEIEENPYLSDTDALNDFMIKKYGLSPEEHQNYSLIAYTGIYSPDLNIGKFKQVDHRILFPIRDHESGSTVGYQARSMENHVYKYYNICDYILPHPYDNDQKFAIKPLHIRYFLFNLFEIKNANPTKLFITEGVADTIKLTSLGLHSVSILGSDIKSDQIALINQHFGNEIELVLFLDNDNSNIGQNKSIKNAYNLFKSGFKNIKIMHVPSGLGSDITDLSAMLQDDITVKKLFDLSYCQATSFVPAEKELLNRLLVTGFFTKNDLMQINPSEIEAIATSALEMYEMLEQYKIPRTKKNYDLFRNWKEVDFNKIFTEAKHDQPIINNTSVTTSFKTQQQKSTSYEDLNLTTISEKQYVIIRKSFEDDIIRQIDETCSKNAISTVVRFIINKVSFDINDFLKMGKKFKKQQRKATIHPSEPKQEIQPRPDFDLIDNYDDEIPF